MSEPDIAKLLRERSTAWPEDGAIRALLLEAADEIDRLRAICAQYAGGAQVVADRIMLPQAEEIERLRNALAQSIETTKKQLSEIEQLRGALLGLRRPQAPKVTVCAAALSLVQEAQARLEASPGDVDDMLCAAWQEVELQLHGRPAPPRQNAASRAHSPTRR